MAKLLHLIITALAVLIITRAQLTENELQIFIDNGVVITEYDENHWLFEHNGIPDHEIGDFPNSDNPNEIEEQEHSYIIPKVPTPVEEPGCLEMGTIATAVNGVPYFNPYTIEGYNAVEGENAEVFDACDGHPQQQGAYHYHQIPDCIYNETNMQLLGVALDGYPIYGPLDAQGVELSSDDLDQCHGRTYHGHYMYVATRDFPYILACYHGLDTAREVDPPPGPNWESCIANCENPAIGCDVDDETGRGNGADGIVPNMAAILSLFVFFWL